MEHLTYLIISLAVCTSAIPSLQPGNNSQSIRIPAAIVVTLLIVFLIPHALAIDYRIGLPWYFRTN
jgi:hypothetical protein